MFRKIMPFALALSLAVSCFASDAPGYKVTKRFPVQGNGGFDYIVFDGSANRLYVSHGTKVDVLDADSGKELGTVEPTPGVHGVAIVPEKHIGFVTNGGNGTVSVFDTESFKTVKTIKVADDPDFIFYDAKVNRVFVCHGDGKIISAIDPDKQEVVGKVELGGGAEASVTDGKGNGFVNLEEEAEVVHYDPQSLAVKDKWAITGCKTPTGLAMDTENNRLFIGCRSKVLAVMDASNGKVVTTLPIGERVDAVAFDPETKTVYASCGDGTVAVVHQTDADHYEPVGDIQTQRSAKTMAYDAKSKRLFLSAAEMVTPPAKPGQKAARPQPKPGSFTVLVVEKQ